MTELSRYVLETLWQDGEFVLSRAVRDGELSPLLVVAPALAQPAPGSLVQLEHEYALRDALGPTWAARPLALVSHRGQPALLLEYPGGELLARLLGQPWKVGPFLRVAIGLAVALGRVHERGLIHKDIKPANILANATTGEVWLTGFGIATYLPRERQAPAPPEVIAGTLAYMAPEQTGRMNRSIDSRSDLYAYGVTLYEMLTGALPFTATDPMEWIHCHIARPPMPPSERAKDIPGPIDAIVMRLLAKTAEERYQTAAGVEADFRRCLAEWESLGRIEPFTLGTHDVSDRLVIPERLYGREREIDTMLTAFDRVVAHGTPELVLVSGYSGVGKSSVVHELHKVLVPPRGLFASGKFDQYKRDIPYATLAQALQSLVRRVLSESDADLVRWREAIKQAVGPNGQLIVNLIPEVELVIGTQPPLADLSPEDAQTRFQMVFRRFLSVFARPEHPLALFLDDLQWLDTATLDLLAHLVTEPDMRHLLLIGAYRDNEVGPSHSLMRTLDAIRKAGASVQEIVLAPLSHNDLTQLIADSLRCELERTSPLAQLVQEKTAGNPFFAIQFVTALGEEGLLTFDPGAVAWSWDLTRIRAKGYTDNVVDLMVGKLNRLRDTTQEAVKQLACLGNSAEVATLSMVHGASKEEMHTALWEAVRAGLLFCSDDAYTFLHDRVQEAAYTLIPEGERPAVHLRIGGLLAARTPLEKLEEQIFDIVNQFNRGAVLIAAQDERERVADLNLIAGRRAKTSTAYAAALTYLAAGRALLAEDCWDRRYELTFALEFHLAECELLTGDLAAAEERLSKLSSRARNLVDIAAVVCLRLTLYTRLDRSDRAIEMCLEYLRRVGIAWSPHPTEETVRREYEWLWRQLGSRPIEALIDLPAMSNPDWRATMDVLAEVMSCPFFTDMNLRCLVVGRMANLSLEHGNCDASCYAYVWLGMTLGPHFGDYRAGFRFGKLSVDLVEKRGLDRFKARVEVSFGYRVIPWTQHLRTGRTLVRHAIDAAQEVGDLTFASYSRNCWISLLLFNGDPLSDAQQEAEYALEFVRKMRFGLMVDAITGQLRLIRTLRGLTPKFGAFRGDWFDEDRFEQHLEGDPGVAIAACFYWINKLQAHFYAADYLSAIAAASKAHRLLWTLRSCIEIADYHFYAALARAAHHDVVPADERPPHLKAIAAHHKQLVVWAENCPENFGNRAALVAAEIARLEGRDLDAMRLYEQAIRLAREHGFIQNEGLAHELAARFCAARGFETIAHAYLRNARYCYLRWGAEGKVRELDQMHRHLREEKATLGPTTTIGTRVEHLDLATVVKTSQAVSGEIVLKKLIQTLMVLALEHAGAERGLLILPRGDELQVEAEATTGRDAVEVLLRQAVVTPSEIPESMLHFVIRTQESMVLDDASAPNQFSADEYIGQNHSRSVLCLPLVKQGKLTGVLYLENNLATHVFTPARIAVLKLLASQAAISLENARLYTDAQQTEAYLRAAQRLSHTGSFGWRPSTGEIVWSEETYRIAGYDRATKPSLELVLQRIHPEDVAFVQETIERASQSGTDLDFEHRYVVPDGSVKYVHVVAHALGDQSGNLEYVGSAMDVTEQHRAKAALEKALAEIKKSEDQLRIIIDTIPTLAWCTLPDGSAEFLNQRWLDYTGLSVGEARNWGWTVVIHDDDSAKLMDKWRAAVGTGEPFEAEARFRRADGKYRWFLFRFNPLRDEQERIMRWYVAATDIEDRRQAEAVLREQASLLNLTHDSIFVRGMDDVITYWNRGAEELYGWTREEALGKVSHQLTQTISPSPLAGIKAELLRTGRWEGELVHTKQDGTQVVVASRWSLQRDELGRPVAILETNNDITESKQAEEAQLRLGAIVASSDDAIISKTLEGVITSWNAGAQRIFGYGADAAVGQQITILIPPDRQDEESQIIERLRRGESVHHFETVRIRKDGREIHVSLAISPIKDAAGQIIGASKIARDITERKRAEAELYESVRRYRYIFESTGVSIWEEDFSQVKIAIDDLKASGVQDFRQYVAAHPEFVEQAISMIKILDVNAATVELFGAHDKHELLASLDKVFTPETREVFAGELIALAEGRTWFQSQTSLKTLQGDRISVGFTITFPTEPAKLNSVLVSIMDMTEQKRAEEALHEAQAELAHVTRVMTIGELVASIAHEVNQPLGAIVTNGQACVRLLSREVPDLDKSREVVGRMIKDGMRASEVIKRIRDLLHKTPVEKAPLNINETIQDVMALVSSDVVRSKVELKAELAADLPPVVGDRIQLQQVILNLILNAKDAMSSVQSHPRELQINSRKSNSGAIVVAVRDSGRGLDPKNVEQIFDPFFTTKPEGMGLGLSISRTIIEAHGGTLWATQNEDKGATIQFTLQPVQRE